MKRTILVVDDDAALRAIEVTMFRKAGYTVLEATNGDEAIDIMMTEREKVPLIFTDIEMPVVNGIELAKTLFVLFPDIKMVFASGHDMPELVRLYGENGFITDKNFVRKPFIIENVTGLIKSLLAE